MHSSKTASKMKDRSDSVDIGHISTRDDESKRCFRLRHFTHCCCSSFQKSVLIFATVLLLSQSASAAKNLEFGNSVEDSIKVKGLQTGDSSGVTLMWGIPDTTAPLGKLFEYSIPNDAFKGNIKKFEVSSDRLEYSYVEEDVLVSILSVKCYKFL